MEAADDEARVFCSDSCRSNSKMTTQALDMSPPVAGKGFVLHNGLLESAWTSPGGRWRPQPLRALRNAVSVGGNGDTIAAMAGGLAEALNGVPRDIAQEGWIRLPADMRQVLQALYSETPAAA